MSMIAMKNTAAASSQGKSLGLAISLSIGTAPTKRQKGTV